MNWKNFALGALHAFIGGALQALVAVGVLPEPAATWKVVVAIALTGAVNSLWQYWQNPPREKWSTSKRFDYNNGG